MNYKQLKEVGKKLRKDAEATLERGDTILSKTIYGVKDHQQIDIGDEILKYSPFFKHIK